MLARLLLGIMLLAGLAGCREKEVKGKISLIFNNKVDFTFLSLNSSFSYENAGEETFKVSQFKYYISHISLIRANGKGVYHVPVARNGSNGIYLVDQASSSSRTITLENVPAGDYEAVSFQMGFALSEVDAPQPSGPLSAEGGMWKSASEGFKFLNFEGSSQQSPLPEKRLFYEFFDATGQQSVKATVYFRNTPQEVAQKAFVRSNISPVVELNVDAYELFSTPHLIIFAKEPSLQGSPLDTRLMQNLSDAFSFDHLHNLP